MNWAIFKYSLERGDYSIVILLLIAIVVAVFGVWYIVKLVKRDPLKEYLESPEGKKETTLEALHAKDERFRNAEFFPCAKGYFITISKTGYLGLSTKNDETEKVYHITEINSYELIKDGYHSVPNLSAAYLGKFFAGDAGAIIGGLGYSSNNINRLAISFSINDFDNPLIEIEFIDGSTSTSSYSYKLELSNINKILSLLNILQKEYKKVE
jgi:hypothetical protein